MNRIKWVASVTACTMALSVLSPATQNLGGMTKVAMAEEANQTTENVTNMEPAAKESTSAYDAIMASNLLAQNALISSDQDVNLSMPKSMDGVLISGNVKNMNRATISITKELDFGTDGARYLVLDALAQKKKKVSLSFYLDDQKTSFATISLAKQKRDSVWNVEKNQCVDLSSLKITGKHKVSFKINTEEAGDLSVFFKDIVFTDSKLPMVSLNIDETKGYVGDMLADKEHGTECYGDMKIQMAEDLVNNATASAVYALDYIVGHGSDNTWNASKKPFRIKLEKKADLFGMGKGRQWLLLAEKDDKTLLRTKLTSYLCEKLGMPYTPKCQFVDVTMNGRYLGSYAICPQTKISKNCIDIDDIDEDENAVTATTGSAITGGYLLNTGYTEELDKKEFITKNKYCFYINSPSLVESENEVQFNYIKDYVQTAEDAIYGKNFKDSSGKSYEDYIDVDSAVDFYLMKEMMNAMVVDNVSQSLDTYLYKKRDGKLFFGPMINYENSAWGSTDREKDATNGFLMAENGWIGRLLQDKKFKTLVQKRWKEYKPVLQEAVKEGGIIDQYASKVKESGRADVAIQSCLSVNNGDIIDDDYMDGNNGNGLDDAEANLTVNEKYDAEVASLKYWITERMNWIDKNIKYLTGMPNMITFMYDSKKEMTTMMKNDSLLHFAYEAEPEKKGYQFKGWYTKVTEAGKTKEIKVDENIPIAGHMIVYAKWKKMADVSKAKNIYFARSEVYCGIWYGVYPGAQLSPTMTPFGAIDEKIKWKSSNKKIATIDNKGWVTGYKPGKIKITATLSNGKKASCIVHVVNGEAYNAMNKDIYMTKKMTMNKGKYGVLNVKSAIPAQSNALLYSSSDSSVVTVKNGVLYAKKAGKAVITVYSSELKTIKTCTVTVKNKKSVKKKKSTKKQ